MSITKRPTLAGQLKLLRSRMGLTLKELSERTGIPVSTLSKVEHGRLTLAYDKLLQLSERLGLPISELFAAQDEPVAASVTARRSFGTTDTALRVNTPNYDYYYLCTDLSRKRMVPIVTHIRARSLEEFGEPVRHSGEEFIYVLKGEIEVHTEFYGPSLLKTGQSIYIDSNMGHAYVTAQGCDEAVILGVCSSSDEALMESLMTLHDVTDDPERSTKVAAGSNG